MSENYYSILEVPENASSDDIKKSYRKLSMMYHPDKNKQNAECVGKFQKISEAYEVLRDNDKRKEYDMRRKNPFLNMMHQTGQNNSAQSSVDELFSNLFGMPFGFMQGMNMGGMNMGAQPNVRIFHNGIPINIQNINQAMQKPIPIIKNILIPIEKILTGTSVPVDVERWVMNEDNKTFEHETIYVNIPKGIDEGEMIILRDKGNIINEQLKGDVKLIIKIENNSEFKRNGLDLILHKTISVKEALCGFSFEMKYLTGKIYTITNHSGNIINNGYNKVIPNMGFSRDEHTGNLIIVFEVKFPEKLSDEIIEDLKKIDF
jgi:DnaJ-class molecular chaperone